MINFKKFMILVVAVLGLASCDNNEELKVVNDRGLTAEQKEVLAQLPDVINVESYIDSEGGATIQTRSSNGRITPDDVAGRYEGKLKNVYMGKPFADKNDIITTYITRETDNNYFFNFEFKPFKMGKMPFELSCIIKRIGLESNGHFSVSKGDLRLKDCLVIGGGYFDVTKMEGDFTRDGNGYKLSFVMESAGKILNFTIAKAHVEYDGKKQ